MHNSLNYFIINSSCKVARKLLKKSVLLAIPTFQDPYVPGRKDKGGPILQALQNGNFDEVILFGLQTWRINAFLVEQAIIKNHPKIAVKRYILPIQDLSCYKNIFHHLKTALSECEDYLEKECEEPVFLLPSPIYDYLFDCWLLLATSLSIKTRICQIESHYSLEGAASSDIDWLNESPKEFRDSCTETQITYPCLSKNQIQFLESIYTKHHNFCIIAKNSNLYSPISQFFFQSARTKNLNYLNVACNEIPFEISNEILFGYQKEIENNQILKRKGLLKKFQKGLIIIENFDVLPKVIIQKVENFISNQKDCRFINIISHTKNLDSVVPCFSLPNS